MTQIMITKKQLEAWEACEDGLARFIEQTNDTDKPVAIVSLIGGKNTTTDVLWLADQFGLCKELKLFAVGCAELVFHLNSDETTTAAKNAIEKAKIEIENPTKENKRAASDAAVYAIEAADFASDAAGFAYAAANAAEAASYAAYSAVAAAEASASADATDATDAASVSADYAAKAANYAEAKIKERINKLLTKIFEVKQ